MRVAKTGLGVVAAVAVAALAVPAAAEDAAPQKLIDRAAIEVLVVQYVTALDTLDADAYAGVFAEDAVFELPGAIPPRPSGDS